MFPTEKVKLANLDDYLAPSQACVKPLLDATNASASTAGVSDKKSNKGPTIMVELDDAGEGGADGPGHFSQIKTSVKKTAVVSLNDCLACSGCVTSAEAVLVTAQSLDEFYTHLRAGVKTIVVTLSPQSRTSLAYSFGMTDLVFTKKLSNFMKSMGVALLMDASVGLDVALIEAGAELVHRVRNKERLPVLASECPGWICYAEKTQGLPVLNLLSSCRSPQQILGAFVKKHLGPNKFGVKPNQLYHVTVMPCFDKKLEGSRDDFFDKEYETRDVDCVLTSSELKQLIMDSGIDFSCVTDDAANLNSGLWNTSPDQSTIVASADQGGSGGYIEFVAAYACEQLFACTPGAQNSFYQVDDNDGDTAMGNGEGSLLGEHALLKYQNARNADFLEIDLIVGGAVKLRFARAFGFRSIQNLMRKIKTKKCYYDYVEVMACPSGCLNGGGQIKLGKEIKEPEKEQTDTDYSAVFEPKSMAAGGIKAHKELVLALSQQYHSQRVLRRPEQSAAARSLYAIWLQGASPYSVEAREHLHTHYHAVEKTELRNPIAIKW